MSARAAKIMIVEPDPDVLEVLVASFSRRFDAIITCMADATTCLDAMMIDRHDLVVAEWRLSEASGLALAEQLTTLGPTPIVLLAEAPSPRDVVAAMRLGVREMFLKPFPVEELLDAAERLLHDLSLRRRHAARYRQMRDLVRRVLCERREMKERMEFICRDLVGAHRRLVTRVLAAQPAAAERSA